MKVMSHYNEPIPGLHPLLGFIVSLGLMIAAQYVHGINTIIEVMQPMPMRIPPIVLDIFQIVAYIGTSLVGTIAAIKFWAEVRGKVKAPKLPKKK